MATKYIPIISLISLGVLSACGSKIDRGPSFSDYMKSPTPLGLVKVLSGKSNNERREIMLRAMDQAGIKYREEDFRSGDYSGRNVIVDYGPATAPMVIIFAHYDRVAGAPGANDNASCVAAAMTAYSMLKKSGLKKSGLKKSGKLTKIKVRFLFSGGEEKGLRGAREYLAAHSNDNVLGVASLELCGIGNAFGIWDVYGPAENSRIVRALGKAGKDENIYFGIHGMVPRFASDHRVFAEKGVPAVGVTAIPRTDEKVLRNYIDHPNLFKWILRSLRPVIFRTYHSSKDRHETVSRETIGMMSRVIFRTIKSLELTIDDPYPSH